VTQKSSSRFVQTKSQTHSVGVSTKLKLFFGKSFVPIECLRKLHNQLI
jgi:hypothetical protein